MAERERDFGQPELGQALAWLRARQYLTQGEVCEEAAKAGEKLSEVYYQLIESGKRKPSRPKLDAVLAVLGSDRQELSGLVAARVWESDVRGGYRPRRGRPRPQVYGRVAEAALSERGEGASWSSPVQAAPLNAGPLKGLKEANIFGGTSAASFSPRLDPSPRDVAASGQLRELADHFLRLSPKKRLKLLEEARRLRAGG